MSRQVFEKSLRIPAAAERVFRWHEEPGALERLIPPGDPVKVLEHTGGLHDGARVVLQMGYPPLTVRWVAIHQGYEAGRRFQDRQASGPLRYWLHTHTFTAESPNSCLLHDHVVFELPLSPLSAVALPFLRRKLEATFTYRHGVTLAAFT